MRHFKGPLDGLVLVGLGLAGGCFNRLYAQAPPDCTVTASFTATGQSTAAFNKSTLSGGTPCTYWTVSYWTNGATGVSVQMEGTNDVAGAAGTSFTALTAVNGSNPMTGANESFAVLCCDYYPWVRFNVGTFTGTSQSMIIRAYGFRTQTSATVNTGSGNVTIVNPIGQKAMAASVSVAVASNQSAVPTTISGPLGQALMAASVPVTLASNQSALSTTISGPLGQGLMAASVPVAIASNQSTLGTNTLLLNGIAPDVNSNGDQGVVNSCTVFAAFNLSGSGNTQIVAASAAKKIIVCSVDFGTATPEDIKFTEGTGSNCGSGTADVTGLYKNISARSHDAMGLPYTATAGDALCLNQANAQALGGTIWYRYQ